MSDLLYLTADRISTPTGGGLVTKNELQALRTLGDVDVLSRAELESQPGFVQRFGGEPWGWDRVASVSRDWFVRPPKLAMGYAGSFPETTRLLKQNGAKVCWSVVAHDRMASWKEFNDVHGPNFFETHFRHLTDEKLWNLYIDGYRQADVIICPSSVPAQSVRDYGPDFVDKRIEIVPHGCDLPSKIAPLPKTFVLGYLGNCAGSDKGVRYLLQAWARLKLKDSVLVFAGPDSVSPPMMKRLEMYGGGNIRLLGWVNHVSTFYDQISVFCAPSVTEGFNLEILESAAHGRSVICSDGAGAVDVTREGAGAVVRARNVDDLMREIQKAYDAGRDVLTDLGQKARAVAENYTWDKIRGKYAAVWRSLL